MHIYIQSAGVQGRGYHWQHCALHSAPDYQAPPTDIEKWHSKLSEFDSIFALTAGYAQDGWSIEFRNLRLKGISDFRGREIVLTVIFSNLTSEKEVRALASAYLDLELQYEISNVSGKIKYRGRYCPALCDAYSGTEDGNYQYDFNAAKKWAENAIAQYSPMLQNAVANHKWTGQINPVDETGLKYLKQQLKTYSLQNRRGLSILWAQVYADPELPADSALTSTQGESSYTPPDEEKSPAQKFALNQLEKVQKGKPIPTPDSRNQKIVIIGLVALVLIAIIIALCTGGKKGDGSAVQPPVPQPAPPSKPDKEITPNPPTAGNPDTDGMPNEGGNKDSTKVTPQGQDKSKNPSAGASPSPMEQQTPSTPHTEVTPNKTENQDATKKESTLTEFSGAHTQPEHSMP